jgi:hypothetical protein
VFPILHLKGLALGFINRVVENKLFIIERRKWSQNREELKNKLKVMASKELSFSSVKIV